MRAVLRFLLLAVLLGGVAAAGYAWTHGKPNTFVLYYVNASSGNDSNDGLTTATAWRTIGKINSTIFPAAVVTINLTGNFSDACLNITTTNFGAATSTIIQAYSAGYTLTPSCTPSPSYRVAGITINGVSNVTIQGGTMDGRGDSGGYNAGILIRNTLNPSVTLTNITVQNMDIHDFSCVASTSCTLDGQEIFVERTSDSDGQMNGSGRRVYRSKAVVILRQQTTSSTMSIGMKPVALMALGSVSFLELIMVL